MQDPDATSGGELPSADTPTRAVPIGGPGAAMPPADAGSAAPWPRADAPSEDGIPMAPAPAADAAPGDDPADQLREERLTSLFEAAVYGPGGERIGKVGQVYIDDQTQDPNWVTVKMGLFGTKEHFVPLDEAVLDGRRLVVPYSKELVASAPGTEIDQNLSPSEEDALYAYYQVPNRRGGGGATDEAPSAAQANAAASAQTAGQPRPGEPSTGQPALGEAVSSHPVSGQPDPGRPFAGQPGLGQPMPGRSAPGQGAPGQPGPRQPWLDRPGSSRPATGQPMPGRQPESAAAPGAGVAPATPAPSAGEPTFRPANDAAAFAPPAGPREAGREPGSGVGGSRPSGWTPSAPAAGIGSDADAGFVAGIRSEYGSSDAPRQPGTPGVGADASTSGAALRDERADGSQRAAGGELGTPRVHDEAREPGDGGAAAAAREAFAARDGRERDERGVVDLNAFRRPADEQ